MLNIYRLLNKPVNLCCLKTVSIANRYASTIHYSKILISLHTSFASLYWFSICPPDNITKLSYRKENNLFSTIKMSNRLNQFNFTNLKLFFSRHEWQLKLQETFGPSHVLVQASNFGVLQLSVFVRRELVWFCSSKYNHCV